MLEKAKITDSFELSDEGVSFDEALETLIHSINNEANLTFLGEIAINFQIKQHLKNRELISRKYKTLKTEKVSPPIIVIGLPRSGTTFLFNLLSKISKFVTNKQNSLAVRFTKHSLFRKLLKKLDYPLAAPSANISSRLSSVQVSDVIEEFGSKIKWNEEKNNFDNSSANNLIEPKYNNGWNLPSL